MKTNYTFQGNSSKLTQKVFGIILFCFIIAEASLQAQTMPIAQALPYSQDFSSLTGVTPVYPAGWQAWQIAASTPSSTGRITPPASDKAIVVGTAASTSSGGYDFNGKIGFLSVASADIALCLAVNTTGFSNIKVEFDVMTIRNLFNGTTENRVNGLVLQYRVGTTGDFTIISYGEEYRNGTTIQTSGTDGIDIVTDLNAILPAACDNKEVVQIRWIYRNVSGSAGSRPSMAIDNVSVQQVNNNADLSSLSVDEKANGTFVPLMLFTSGTLTYNHYLVKANPVPQISAETSSASATKIITQATSLSGTDEEKTASVEVTAQDGTTKKTYSVKFIETDNVFISGNPGQTGAGWSQTNMFIGTSIIDGNGKYEGANYARCLSASTQAYLVLPETDSVGVLKFYAKKIDSNVSGNLRVSTKRDAGEWTVVQDLGDISTASYQEYSVIINQNSVDSMFVRLEITKNGDTYPSAGYYIDDFSYTDYVNPGPGTNISALNSKNHYSLRDIPGGFNIYAENAILHVYNVAGSKVAEKLVNGNADVILNSKGLYILKIDTSSGLDTIKYLMR